MHILGSTGIVAGVIAAAGVLKQAPGWYWWVLFAVIAVYAAMMVLMAFAVGPSAYLFPIQARWENLTEYFPVEGEDLLELLISQYLRAIDANLETLENKGRWVRIGFIGLAAILAVMFGMLLVL